MAFTNLFRRHSGSHEGQAANYSCLDENSIAETLLDELEIQCQNILTLPSKTKRNSVVYEQSGGLLASTYHTSSSKRHSSVDYSWLSPQNNLLQTANELYHLPDIIKMELNELIRNVSPEDCTFVVNQFRRQVRSQMKNSTPENIIAIFRKTLADYIDQKQKHRTNSNDTLKIHETNHLSAKTICSLVRNNRILPKHRSDTEQYSIAELTQISITSPTRESTDVKPRSNTCT
jgi:DNA topoisomerase VI subunit A